MKKRVNYINNKDLLKELINLKETNKASDELHFMFYEMCKGIASKPRFFMYTWKEDMIVDAYLRCIKYASKFDVNRDNPFSYFTTVIHNCYFKYREVEMKYQNSKWVELSNHLNTLEHEHGITLELTDDIKNKIYKSTI